MNSLNFQPLQLNFITSKNKSQSFKSQLQLPAKSYKSNSCVCHKHQAEPFIGNYEDAPFWMRYDCLKVGYRINFSSFKLILKSLFILHNQTVSTWIHLIGAFILILIGFLSITENVQLFQKNGNTKLSPKFEAHPIGSGRNFLQNLTRTCFDESVISKNQQSQFSVNENNLLAYDLCLNESNRHECYLNKSHQKQLRNWLQFHGISLNKLEHYKIKIEQQVIPKFVNQLTYQIQNRTHHMKIFIQSCLNLLKIQTEKLFTTYNIDMKEFQLSKETDDINLNQEETKTLQKWPLILFIVCNGICLFFSVIYHLFYPMSQKTHNYCVCTDFAGIGIGFGGHFIPCVYYGMYLYFQVAQIYITLIILSSIILSIMSFSHKFQNRQDQTFRLTIYTIYTLVLLIPVAHLTINEMIFNNYNDTYSFVNSLDWYILGLVLYTIGMIIYGSHYPERIYPGKYDYFGHSHQVWHIFVVLGMISVYLGCLENYLTRRQSIFGY